MKVRLVQIGKAKGIRIPKAMLELCGFGNTAQLELREKTIVLSPVRGRRAGWDEAFAAMAARGDDEPLWESVTNDSNVRRSR